MSDSRQQVWDVYARAIEVFDRKNADYGDAWRRNGWRGNLSRIFEKAERVRNLAWRPDPRVPAVGDEQVLETLQDMLNTTAFAIINLIEEVEYGHEVPRSERVRQFEERYEPGVALAYYDQVGAEPSHHDPGTQVISQDHLRKAIAENDPQALVGAEVSVVLPTGPDEQGAAEKKHDPRPRRKPTTPVRDHPQA